MAMYDPANCSSSSQHVTSMEKTACTAQEKPLKDKLLFDMIRRAGLRRSVLAFKTTHNYSREAIERKTCIWPGGQTSSWHGKSSGIMWVGVHGTHSVCVVSMAEVQDKKDPNIPSPGRGLLTAVRKAAISDILDLGDPQTYCTLRQVRCKGIEKPFGVVSVIPLTDVARKHQVLDDGYAEDLGELQFGLCTIELPPTADEKATKVVEKIQLDMAFAIIDEFMQTTLKAEHDEKKAINFLQEKMKSKMAFTMNGTIQTAIAAFQHLFQKEFKANEIKVSVIDPNYGVTAEEIKYKDEYVRELTISEIAEHLAVINKPGTMNKVSEPMLWEPKACVCGNIVFP